MCFKCSSCVESSASSELYKVLSEHVRAGEILESDVLAALKETGFFKGFYDNGFCVIGNCPHELDYESCIDQGCEYKPCANYNEGTVEEFLTGKSVYTLRP